MSFVRCLSRTTALTLLTAVAAAGIATLVVRRSPSMGNVAPDLRSPMALALGSIRLENMLGLMRWGRDGFSSLTRTASPDVMWRREEIPAVGEQPAVPVLVYEPRGAEAVTPAVLWIHGGGFIMGTAEQDHKMCLRVARELGVRVVNVSYRLAPEHPYPAGLNDCFHTLTWMRELGADVGIDPDRIAVAGESAGGGLAAALAQKAYDHDVPVVFQLLVYPMIDDRTILRPTAPHRGSLVWTRNSNAFGWRSYLGRTPHMGDAPQYAAPARRENLAGLAPAWIGVGDLDLFYDEDVEYARRLQNAGVPCELQVVPGMYHGAEHLNRRSQSMQEFSQWKINALRRGLFGT